MVMKLAEQKAPKAKRKRARPDLEMIADGVRLILEGIGEDLERAGLKETPQRVAEMYSSATQARTVTP